MNLNQMKHSHAKYLPHLVTLSLIVMAFAIFPKTVLSENLKPVVRLEGDWKFTVGDDKQWASPSYNDAGWDVISVPGTWEAQGYREYNGFAWYRKKFTLSNSKLDEYLFLLMGYIDDADEVYLNGYLLGSGGNFPPYPGTAYQDLRKYHLPNNILIQNGENVIAVRVYDEYLDGGIYNGPVGVFYDSDNSFLTLNLAGYWHFSTEKIDERSGPEIYGSEKGKIFVPGTWESQGYPEYDGRAVYTTQFRANASLNVNDLILVLGFIDDMDVVYLNGTKIGTVYNIRSRDNYNGWEYRVFRAYKLPPGLIVKDSLNTIMVKVNDTGGLGGIYEGPVGLTTEANFKRLKERNVKEPQSFWDAFNEFFFD